MDRAHKQTDIILAQTERQLPLLYVDARRTIQRKIAPLIAEMTSDDPTLTQDQRLKYANKTGNKKKIVKIIADAIVEADLQATAKINRTAREIYDINFKQACDDVIKQLEDSLKGGG